MSFGHLWEGALKGDQLDGFFTCWFSVKRLGMKQKIHFKEPLDGPFGVLSGNPSSWSLA